MSVFSDVKSSTAQLKLTNKGKFPLTEIGALVELYDEEGKHLLTFSLYSIAPEYLGRPPSVPAYVPNAFSGHLGTVVFPGSVAWLSTGSPRILTSCPAAARLTFLRLEFLSGPPFEFSVPDFRTDPALKSAKPAEASYLPLTARYETFVPLTIANHGRITATYMEGYPDDRLPDYLEAILSSWTFVPAHFGGTALGDQVDMLFRFHTTRQPDWNGVAKFRDHPNPFIVVDIFPPEPGTSSPDVFYAGKPLGWWEQQIR